MTRKLDFIVAGTGRSGTSAVARYLSAAVGVHCGLELFSPRSDHSRLIPPQCFTDLASDEIPRGTRRPKAGLLRFSLDEIQRRGQGIRYYGNKTPNYIARLRGLLDEIAPARAILCWRDIRAVARSYARRADDAEDQWDPGKRAIFALTDAATALHALADIGPHDLMIVPNRAVVADWEGVTRRMLAYLLPDLGEVSFDPVNLAAIDDRLKKTKERHLAEPVFSEAEERAVAMFEATGADRILDRSEPFLLSEVRSSLAEVVARLPQDMHGFVRGLVRDDGRRETRVYFRKWQNQHGGGHSERVAPVVERPRRAARQDT